MAKVAAKSDEQNVEKRQPTPLITPEALKPLPYLAVVFFASQIIRGVVSSLWGASRTRPDWVVTVNNLLAFVSELAAAPSKLRARASTREWDRLCVDADQYSYDAKVTANPAAMHVMSATTHLAGCILAVREIASHLEQRRLAAAEKKANHLYRLVGFILGEALEATPADRVDSFVSALRDYLASLQETVGPSKDEETLSHRLQALKVLDTFRYNDDLSSTPLPKDVPSSPNKTPLPVLDAIKDLENAGEELAKIQWQVARKIERILAPYVGQSFGSVDANKEFADAVNKLLRANGARLVCPTCKTPSMLFLQTGGTTRHGSFQHQHSKDGKKTRHGGSVVVPLLSVVPALITSESGAPKSKTG